MLAKQNDRLLFTSHYMFSSVSAAAATVTRAAANGRIFSRLPDGRTYAEWDEAENSNLSSIPAAEFQPIRVLADFRNTTLPIPVSTSTTVRTSAWVSPSGRALEGAAR
jgi:hypothetical protein